ncbi:hypothetical protein [Maricaulis salignorans]|uniref:hypothetical protein n=1 Tax=Maricaulis salignorans TaxID=144026 RepID=UPI003A9250F5
MPDWRRLGLGLVVVLLMSLQGAAAMAHRNAHYQEFEPGHISLTAESGSDAPMQGNPAPTAQCKLCHSSIGSVSILPAAQTGLSAAFTVSGLARPRLHQPVAHAAPGGVWRVRGPPLHLHA